MKKLYFLLLLAAAGAAAHSQGTKPDPGNTSHQVPSIAKQKNGLNEAAPAADSTEKLFTVQGTEHAFTVLLSALEKSNESHVIIEQLKQWMIPQLNMQLEKPADPPAKK
jgi:hypothetical protein